MLGAVANKMRTWFWTVVIGGVVLYVFFVALAEVSPREIAGVTIVVAVLAATFVIRSLRLSSQIAANPVMRRAQNRLRERRGF